MLPVTGESRFYDIHYFACMYGTLRWSSLTHSRRIVVRTQVSIISDKFYISIKHKPHLNETRWILNVRLRGELRAPQCAWMQWWAFLGSECAPSDRVVEEQQSDRGNPSLRSDDCLPWWCQASAAGTTPHPMSGQTPAGLNMTWVWCPCLAKPCRIFHFV